MNSSPAGEVILAGSEHFCERPMTRAGQTGNGTVSTNCPIIKETALPGTGTTERPGLLPLELTCHFHRVLAECAGEPHRVSVEACLSPQLQRQACQAIGLPLCPLLSPALGAARRRCLDLQSSLSADRIFTEHSSVDYTVSSFYWRRGDRTVSSGVILGTAALAPSMHFFPSEGPAREPQ